MSLQSRIDLRIPALLRRNAADARWYRAFGLGAIHSLVRLVLSFITIKLTAVYLGPSGLALVAQLGNFIAMCHGLLGGGLGTATARLYPEFRDDRARRKRFLATAWRLGFLFALGSMVAIALGAAPLARWLLDSNQHAAAVILSGLAVACLVLNSVILNAINGAGEPGRLVISNLIGSVFAFAIYVPATMWWGIPGALIGFALSQAVSLPVSLVILRRSSSVAPEDFRGKIDRMEMKRILAFVPMLVVHAVMSPLALILIRNMVASRLGLETAGLWQATWRLSEVYLAVVLLSLSLYFYPRLGEVVGTPGLRNEIVRTLARAVGTTAVIALALFLTRDWVVQIVLTEKFLPVRDLMPFQLLGDVLTVAVWTLGFVLVALVRSRWYIATAILMPALYYGAALYLVPSYGARGVTWAYCLTGLIHFSLSAYALRDVLVHRADGRSGSRRSDK